MFRLLVQMLKQGVATQKELFPALAEYARGLPTLDAAKPCLGEECSDCVAACPTGAIDLQSGDAGKWQVKLNVGACIGCGICLRTCSTGTITKDSATATAVTDINKLIRSNMDGLAAEATSRSSYVAPAAFRNTIAVRVVSTGCSACDLEVGAAGNPIFDMERFGVQVVASPRMADVLLVTGPAGSAMQEALLRTYEAMPAPKLVIACGTCAISGGVHKGGYARANGVSQVLPVDIFVPGCPPHPWSIIHALWLAMGRL